MQIQVSSAHVVMQKHQSLGIGYNANTRLNVWKHYCINEYMITNDCICVYTFTSMPWLVQTNNGNTINSSFSAFEISFQAIHSSV